MPIRTGEGRNDLAFFYAGLRNRGQADWVDRIIQEEIELLGESAFLAQATGGRNEVTESCKQCGGILTAVEEGAVGFALATALAFSQVGEKLRLLLRIARRYETDVEEADIGLAECGHRGIRGAQNVAGCCVVLAGLNAHVGAVGEKDNGAAIAAIMIAEFLERARVGQTVVGF